MLEEHGWRGKNRERAAKLEQDSESRRQRVTFRSRVIRFPPSHPSRRARLRLLESKGHSKISSQAELWI